MEAKQYEFKVHQETDSYHFANTLRVYVKDGWEIIDTHYAFAGSLIVGNPKGAHIYVAYLKRELKVEKVADDKQVRDSLDALLIEVKDLHSVLKLKEQMFYFAGDDSDVRQLLNRAREIRDMHSELARKEKMLYEHRANAEVRALMNALIAERVKVDKQHDLLRAIDISAPLNLDVQMVGISDSFRDALQAVRDYFADDTTS